MRLFQHIILDFENNNQVHPNEYWASNALVLEKQKTFSNVNLFKKFKKNNTSSWDNETRYTLVSSNLTPSVRKLIMSNKSFGQKTLPSWFNLININFLRKERLYTKLKYSRSPAYDTVSGGAAAIFAGFLGFLVSEKFGMELVDSGDFYFLTMYLVFISFSVRPLLTVLNPTTPFNEVFSLKPIFLFYSNLITLIIKGFIK